MATVEFLRRLAPLVLLPFLFFLAQRCAGYVVERKTNGSTLHGRSLATFSFSDQYADCRSYYQKLSSWLTDVGVLCDAATDALDAISTNEDIKLTLKAFLGVQPDDQAKIDEIRSWFKDVQAFASGTRNFPERGISYDNAWIMCGDNYQTQLDPYGQVLDRNGQGIVFGNQPLYFNQVPAYQPYLAKGEVPFWIADVNGYMFAQPDSFQPGQPGTRCSNAFAFTFAGELGRESVMTFCVDPWPASPNGAPPPINFFAANTIAQAMRLVARDDLIDNAQSGSGIMLHEMMHAVRGAADTNDNCRTSAQCVSAAIRDPVGSAQASPHCAVFFAVAMYYLQHGGDSPYVFWWEGKALSHADASLGLLTTLGPG